MKEMEPVLTDFGKFMTPQLLHVCYQTLHSWNSSHSALPRPWSQADAAEFLALAKQNHGEEVSDEDFVLQFAKICAGDLNPMCAAIGGIGPGGYEGLQRQVHAHLPVALLRRHRVSPR